MLVSWRILKRCATIFYFEGKEKNCNFAHVLVQKVRPD